MWEDSEILHIYCVQLHTFVSHLLLQVPACCIDARFDSVRDISRDESREPRARHGDSALTDPHPRSHAPRSRRPTHLTGAPRRRVGSLGCNARVARAWAVPPRGGAVHTYAQACNVKMCACILCINQVKPYKNVHKIECDN